MEIYEKYRQKIGYKSAKKKKIKAKTGQLVKQQISLNNLYPLHLRQKSTDARIDELTRLIKKLGVKIDKIGIETGLAKMQYPQRKSYNYVYNLRSACLPYARTRRHPDRTLP